MVKVLLVEDNANDALLLRRMFRKVAPGQYDVTHHCRLEDASLLVATEAMDIILLDPGLPDANGLDAVRQMVAAAPHIPVVVMTGNRNDQLAAQALRAGAQDFLVKSEIEPSIVLRSLRYAIERKGLEERLLLEQERAQITLNAIGDAVICIDSSGAINFLNHAAEMMTGLALGPGDYLLGDVLDLTSPQRRANQSTAVLRSQRAGPGQESHGQRRPRQP